VTRESAIIDYDHFAGVEMRVGRVVRVRSFDKARKPAWRLWIDFGPFGERKSSAQITKLYEPDELTGRLVVAVTNFEPRQIADFMSEVLVLGCEDENGDIVLLEPERDVPLGTRIY
jgi:tRNA-binding protein